MLVDPRALAVKNPPPPDQAFFTKIDGESMEPWLPDGTIVLCKKCKQVTAAGRYVYWIDEENGTLCKRMEKVGEDELKVTSDNPEAANWLLTHVEDDLYRTQDEQTIRIQVYGRVVYPPDTAKSIMEQVTQQLKKVVG